MAGETFPSLVAVMDRLLAPDGCPWDREQTLQNLKAYLIEEAYELVEAMDADDPEHHREELGDVLFQVVFQSALARARHGFTIDDVIAGIRDKLVRRHPHVFGDATVRDSAEQVRLWERLKADERVAKGEQRRALAGVPSALPALLRAARVGEKAAAVGFDWPGPAAVLDKVREEIDEVARSLARGDREAAAREVGDVLFAAAQLARHLGADAEDRLRATIAEFARRFEQVEDRLAAQGRSPRDATLDELESLWQEAKRGEGASPRRG